MADSTGGTGSQSEGFSAAIMGQAPVPAAQPGASHGASGGHTELGTVSHSVSDARGLTPEQHQALADHLVKSGVLSQAQANEALTQSLLEAGAITPEQAAAARKTGAAPALPGSTGPGSLAPEVRAYLESQGMKPPRPTEYQLPPQDGEIDTFDKAADAIVRNWLSAAGFSVSNGSYLAEQLDKAGRQFDAMDPVQQEIYARTERELLFRALGPTAEQRLALARQLVNELDERQPGLKALLDMGPGHSANVVMVFVAQAEILAARWAA